MIFASVVGHSRVKEALSRSLENATVHPGCIFAGPPGVGKRLVAGEFARAWLCRRGAAEPCGECCSCRVAGGQPHPDLLLVAPEEKKKSIGVDQVRDLGTWLAQTPFWGPHKAVIVDPADLLTPEAANALLKTIEEPPPGSVLLLVTARPGALAPTLRSRCRSLSFGALSEAEVAEVLRRNGWPVQAARLAAALAEGSPGQALARDGKLWQSATESVRSLVGKLEAGDRGAALSFAEGLGEGRERALVSLQVLIGLLRTAARQRLGAPPGESPPEDPVWPGLATDEIGRLLGGALETHRRLEGDRPPNAKLALATLLAGAAGETFS